MALGKQVKIGGAYYKGYELIVSSNVGDYVLDISEAGAGAVNSLSIIPDSYGAGDKFAVSHMSSDTTTTLAILATNIFNPGAGVATIFDFPALEKMNANDKLRVVYTNTATMALAVHVVAEYVGLIKTS